MRRVRMVAVLLCALLASGVLILPGSTAATQPNMTPAPPAASPPPSPADIHAVLSDALFVSILTDHIAGPVDANANLSSGEFQYLSGGVELSDFYANTGYFTPPDTPAGSWTIGFAFWAGAGKPTPSDVFFQVRNGAARWGFGQQIDGKYQILQQGNVAPGAIDFATGAVNTIDLVVTRGLAILVGNDHLVAAAIDLHGATGSGDVAVEAGFQADDADANQALPFSMADFNVWDLSPAAVATALAAAAPTTQLTSTPAAPPAAISPTPAGQSVATSPAGANPALTQVFEQERATAMANSPAAYLPPGSLQQTTAGVSYVPAGVALANVYATATFDNPDDLSAEFDIALGFRDTNNDTEYRFVVSSGGGWGLSIGSGAPVTGGPVTNFDATPGGSNTLEIVAQGAIGLLAVNGVVLQQVDLSGNQSAGDVYVASGMFDTYTVEGRQISFSSFAVYQLPS